MENETEDKIHVLEFSPMQKQFHWESDPLWVCNHYPTQQIYGIVNDYFCLGIFKSLDDLGKYLDIIQSVMCRDEYSPWIFKENARKEDVDRIKKILRWID